MESNNKTRCSKQRGAPLIGAIDQGTSSTRFLVFESGTGKLMAKSQIEIKRIVPKEGWVEIDPNTIMDSVYQTIENVHEQLNVTSRSSMKNSTKLNCIGICNQRESAVVWDRVTGKALYNVIVWMDNRTNELVDRMIDSAPGRDFNWLKDKTGLPMSTYFSAFKLKWLIDNVDEVKLALRDNRLLFGTVDTWILWNLTGNHLTDVTNASRTFLMDIETLDWDKTLCKLFNVPMNILPKIRSSADNFGLIQHGPLKGLPITGVIGDQSAALFGHNCLQLGQTKATFGTGCFIMQNIGPGPLNGAMSGVQREAKRGLITTVGYKLGDRPVCYALEGSIKIAGAAITWMRDNMQLISDYEECDKLVSKTSHSAGVYFVPALGGLYSPYWDPNASGLFIGLSQFTKREHLIRATFDSIAYQTNDILSLMRGVANGLMIDGGLCKSDHLSQILADITGIDIVRPSMSETSALGAAMVAGCGAGIWAYEEMLAGSNTGYEYACSASQTHHYPHESLYHDDKFPWIIEHGKSCIAAPSSVSGQKKVTNEASLLAESVQTDTGGCRLNYDAGGGGGGGGGGRSSSINVGSETDDARSSQVSSRLISLDSDDDTTQALSELNRELNREIASVEKQPQFQENDSPDKSHFYISADKLHFYTPSSGYNSSDNLEPTVTITNESIEKSRRDSHVLSTQLACHSLSAEQMLQMAGDSEGLEQSETQSSESGSDTKLPDPSNGSSIGTLDGQFEAGDAQIIFPAKLSTCLTNYICAPVANEERGNSDFEDEDFYEEEEEERYSEEDSKVNEKNILEHIDGSTEPENSTATTTTTIDNEISPAKPVDVFQSYISLEHRTELVHTWRRAVERSMAWTKIHHEEVRRLDYQRLSSLPISMYLFLTVGMVALSGIISATSGKGFISH